MRIIWNRLDAAEWSRALARHGAPMPQHGSYGAVAEAAGRRVLRAEIEAGGRVIGHAQILRRGPLALLSRGPVWAGEPDPATRRAALRALGAAQPLVIATPEAPVPGAGLPLVTPRHVAEIDLVRDPAELRAAMTAKWRNRLVAAEAERLDVRPERPAPEVLRWLFAAEAGQRRARGYRALPPGFVAAWGAVDPDGLRFWSAWQKGERVAAMLFLLHRPWASYHVGWSGPQGRAAHAHPLILWTAMRALAAEGIARLDLGDVNTEDAPGLARFKIGAGATVRPLGATILLPPVSPPRFGRGR